MKTRFKFFRVRSKLTNQESNMYLTPERAKKLGEGPNFDVYEIKEESTMDEKMQREYPVRLKLTKNFKGEIAREVTVRGDTVKEAKKLLDEVWKEVHKIK